MHVVSKHKNMSQHVEGKHEIPHVNMINKDESYLYPSTKSECELVNSFEINRHAAVNSKHYLIRGPETCSSVILNREFNLINSSVVNGAVMKTARRSIM